MNPDRTLPWDWYPGTVPENVMLAPEAYVETTYSFLLCSSQRPNAIEIGTGSSIYLGVMFDLGPEARARIGSFVLMNGARIICDSEITIGDHCLISWNVVLMDSYRFPLEAASRRRELERVPTRSPRRACSQTTGRAIHIGPNVWVGFDCCVLPGVTIGEGAVVGARSVVTGDVPPYTVVAGNPARVIRQLERPAPAPCPQSPK